MQRTGTNPIQDLKTFKNDVSANSPIQPNYVLSYTIKPVIYGTLAASLAKVPHRFALITGFGLCLFKMRNRVNAVFFKKWCMVYMHMHSNMPIKSFSKSRRLKIISKYATGIDLKTDGGGEWFWGECAGFCSTGFA